jgi:hypothetical protein
LLAKVFPPVSESLPLFITFPWHFSTLDLGQIMNGRTLSFKLIGNRPVTGGQIPFSVM